MGIFKRILVPADGSKYALDAVRLATRLAEVHGSELKLFHVLDRQVVEALRRLSKETDAAIREDLQRQAAGFLKDMEGEIRRRNIPVEVLVREGVPHDAILAEADTWKADLIVMGKLGRRGISHIVLGSVTERVIEFSDVPVLVVK